MDYNQIIFPSQIKEYLSSNQISQMQLKDGTIINITDAQYNPQQNNQKEEMVLEPGEEEAHNHHRIELGYFGHHFQTEYSEICPDCLNQGGVIKKRKNYVLYVSNNCSEKDVALKHKIKKKEKEIIQDQIKEQIQEQIKDKIEEQIKENIEEQIQEQIKEDIEEQIQEHIEDQINEHIQEQINEQQQNQEQQILKEEIKEEIKEEKKGDGDIIVERYVECNDVPIIDEKIILKKDEDKKEEILCNECKNEEEINNLEQKENICNECKEEKNVQNEDNIDNEVQGQENNINNVQEQEGENDMEKQNVNEIGEENICDDCQVEQQNEGNDEQKVTNTVQVLIPENQNEN